MTTAVKPIIAQTFKTHKSVLVGKTRLSFFSDAEIDIARMGAEIVLASEAREDHKIMAQAMISAFNALPSKIGSVQVA